MKRNKHTHDVHGNKRVCHCTECVENRYNAKFFGPYKPKKIGK